MGRGASCRAVRLKAGFETKPPRAEVSAGEKRMTRMWMEATTAAAGRGSKGSDVVGELPGSRAHSGGMAFSPATDAGFRAVGNMNPDRGTFGAWIKAVGGVRERGTLFSAKSFVAGGARGGVYWAIGFRPVRVGEAGKGWLFVGTRGGSTEAAIPLAVCGPMGTRGCGVGRRLRRQAVC